MNKKTLCILLSLCALFIITADASDSQLNTEGRKLALHQVFKYENGKLSYSKEYEYDSHGRVIKTSSYYSYGAARQYFDYKYDENDKLISTLQSSNYDEDAYVEYQYDPHGNMLPSTEYYNGKIRQWNYEYDMHGNLLLKTETEKSEINPDIVLTKQERHTYTYDEQGRIIADYSSHPYYGYNYKYRYEYTWINIE